VTSSGFSSESCLEIWRLLDVEFEDPYMNIAVEESVARNVGEGTVESTIRFWRNLDAVVIGCNQDAEAEVNSEQCAKLGTRIVRRFTGGGAVYHDGGNLNFSISVPKSHRLVEDDLLGTYQVFSLAVIGGLKLLGLEDAKWEDGNNVFLNGSKLSGLAACLRWGAFFCHGSILVSSDVSRVSNILHSTHSGSERYTRSVVRPITTLSDQIGRAVSIAEVKIALKKGFEEAFSIMLTDRELSPEEWSVTNEVYREKYSTQEWNLRGREN